MKTTFLVVYGAGIKNEAPSSDGSARLSRGMEIGGKIDNAIIILGARYPQGKTAKLSADYMSDYLVAHQWPISRIALNPLGFDTISETNAAAEVIGKRGGGRIIAVTAWYHAFRVWLTWIFCQKRFVRVAVSWTTHSWTDPFREVMKLPLIFLPEKKREILRRWTPTF